MKHCIILLLMLLGISTHTSAQESTSIELIQKGIEYAKRENYDLAVFYLRLTTKDTNIPDSIKIKGKFYLQCSYYFSKHYDLSLDSLKHYSLIYDRPDRTATKYVTRIARTLANFGKHEEALMYGKLAEQRIKHLCGELSLDYAFALDNLSIRYSENEQVDSALILCKKAIKIISKNIGKKNIDYATSQQNLAVLYCEKGKYNKAIKHNKKAIRLHQLLKSDTTYSYAMLLDNTGSIYKNKGNKRKGIDYNLKAIKIFQAINDTCSPDYITALNNLAIKYHEIREYDTAIKTGHKSLSLSQKNGDTNSIRYAIALQIMASSYLNKGDIQNYILSTLKVLHIFENTIGEHHSQYIETMKELIHTYIATDNYIQAISLLEKIIEDITTLYGEDNFILISWLTDLASCYKYGVGDFSKTISLCQKALELGLKYYKEESLIYAQNLHNISAILAGIVSDEIPLEMEQEAFAIRQKILPTNHPHLLSSLKSLMVNYAACNMLKEAISIGEYVLNTTRNTDGVLLHNLATAYSMAGDIPKAIYLLERASEIYKKKSEIYSIHYLDNLSELFFNYYKAGLHSNTKKVIEELLPIADKMAFNNLLSLTQEERNYFWERSFYFTLLFSQFSYQHNDDKKYVQLAYDAALKFKNIQPVINTRIKEQYASLESDQQYNNYKEMQMLERKINILQEKAADKKTIESLKRQAKNLNRKLSQATILNTNVRKLFNIRWEDIQSNLSPSNVAIEFSFANKSTDSLNYVALILKKSWDSPKAVSFSLPTDSLFKYNWNTQQTYNIIWSPIEQYLAVGDTIYFSASGILHQIPIESLPVGNGKIMSDIYHMHRLSSTRELALRKEPMKYKKAVLYGGLNYDMTDSDMRAESSKYQKEENPDILYAYRGLLEDSIRGHKWIQLDNTRQEAEYIKGLLEKNGITTSLFEGNNGNEESFKALSGQEYNIIHLATHGFFYPNEVAKKKDYFKPMLIQEEQSNISPLDRTLWRSGLVLSGGNRVWRGDSIPEEVEDGILKSQEIKDMDLRGADLVVLSACHTGQGEVTSEGVFGLQRAFKMAGVQTIVMSLTEVDDQTTMVMMNKFYTNLLSGQSKHDAFYNAQRYIRSIKPDPIYWAGWIMLD